MEQDRGGGGGGGGGARGLDQIREMQHQQDQRALALAAKPHQETHQNHPQQPPPPPQQPQKCPRCESLNTKFCYYNNYSLSQPRYFCKTCRRYWTQGGTLRNVPVGGGCRKGKRLKRSSSPENQHSTSSATSTLPFRSKGIDSISISSSPLVPIAAGAVPVPVPGSMYYPGGGFLSSLPTFQSFNQPLNYGGEFGGNASNLALLQGFSLPFHSPQMQHHQQIQHQQHQQQQQQLYLHQSHDLNMGISDTLEEKVAVVQQSRPSTSHQEWSLNFGNNNPITSEAGGGFWSNTNTNTTTSSATTTGLGVSLNSTHWTDHLQGYSSPPPPQAQPSTTTSSTSPSFL